MPTKSVPIKLSDGKERELRLDYNALCRAERALNVFGIDIGKALAGSVGLSALRAILWAGLSHEDKTLTEEKVGELIDLAELPYIGQKIAEAFAAAFPAEAASKKEGGPTPGKSGTSGNT